MDNSLYAMLLKLGLSTLVGGLVGLERQTHGRAAGLRTHTLVCLGSTLFTLCSFEIAGISSDPGRIAAQIVAGVGFLGAGTIMRQGSIVIGLTSAASIWSIAAVGIAIAIGGNATVLGIATAIIAFMVLHYLPILERIVISEKRERSVNLRVRRVPNEVAAARNMLSVLTDKVRVSGVDHSDIEVTELKLWMFLETPGAEDKLIEMLESSDWIVGFTME